MLITTGNANIEMAKNDKFILYFAHLIVPLASPKILTLGNAKKNLRFPLHFSRLLDKIFTFEKRNKFPFYSLNQFFRIFGFAEDTHARHKKTINYFFLYSLIRIFAQ